MPVQNGDLLVDGGYLNNIPVDVMRSMGVQTVGRCTSTLLLKTKLLMWHHTTVFSVQWQHSWELMSAVTMQSCQVAGKAWLRTVSNGGQVVVVDVEDRDDSVWHNLTAYDGGLSGWRLLWDRWCPIPAFRWGTASQSLDA